METRACELCGLVFTPRLVKQTICTVGCRRATRAAATAEPRSCEHCGVSYQPHRADQRDCSVECRKRRRKRAENQATSLRRRGGWPEILKCDRCGGEFEPTRGRARFCSRKCKDDQKNATYYEPVPRIAAICRVCETPFETNNPRQAACALHVSENRPLIPRQLRLFVYERDGWTCQLCDQPVDPEAPGRSSRGASLDHVIPYSRGGNDTIENLRLAHHGCNTSRSNRV